MICPSTYQTYNTFTFKEINVAFMAMKVIGVEPTSRGQWGLNPQRLPISPHSHKSRRSASYIARLRSCFKYILYAHKIYNLWCEVYYGSLRIWTSEPEGTVLQTVCFNHLHKLPIRIARVNSRLSLGTVLNAMNRLCRTRTHDNRFGVCCVTQLHQQPLLLHWMYLVILYHNYISHPLSFLEKTSVAMILEILEILEILKNIYTKVEKRY